MRKMLGEKVESCGSRSCNLLLFCVLYDFDDSAFAWLFRVCDRVAFTRSNDAVSAPPRVKLQNNRNTSGTPSI